MRVLYIRLGFQARARKIAKKRKTLQKEKEGVGGKDEDATTQKKGKEGRKAR